MTGKARSFPARRTECKTGIRIVLISAGGLTGVAADTRPLAASDQSSVFSPSTTLIRATPSAGARLAMIPSPAAMTKDTPSIFGVTSR